MTDRRRFSLKYGSEISLLYDEEAGYLSCPGGAHPKLVVRPGRALVELLSFENCVFVIHPPIDVMTTQHQHATVGVAGGMAAGVAAGSVGAFGQPADALHHAGGSGGSGIGGSAGPPVPPGTASGQASSISSRIVLMTEITYGAKFLLKHKQSGLFVSILTTHPSEMDSDSNMIALLSESEASQTRSAVFRFTPRYKVHNEGDYVCEGDQLLLQTFAHKLFLHVSELAASVVLPTSSSGASLHRTVPPSPLRRPSGSQLPLTPQRPTQLPQSAALEVNGSETMSAWLVRRYDGGIDHADFQKVQGKGKPPVLLGSPVALFHRERESLLTSSVARPVDGGAGGSSADVGGSTMSPRIGGRNANKSGGVAATLETRRRGYQSMHNMARESSGGTLRSPASPYTSRGALQSATSTVGGDGGGSDGERHGSSANSMVFPILSPYTNGYLSNDFSFATLRCSCAAYWVFEHSDPTVGGPLRFGVPYRLRQAATNMYLAVIGHGVDGAGLGSGQLLGSGDWVAFASNRSFSQTARRASTANNLGGSGSADVQLALVAAPSTEEMQQRTLFVVEHTFFPEARIVTETDFFRIKNVDTGLWLCTEGGSASEPHSSSNATTRCGGSQEVVISLEQRPSMHDAWMSGHISQQAHKDVLHIFYNYDALQRYRNIFAEWTKARSATAHIVSLQQEHAQPSYDTALDNNEASMVRRTDSATTSTPSTAPPVVDASKKASSPKSPQLGAMVAPGGDGLFSTKHYAGTIKRCADALTSLILFCSASNDPDPFTREGLPLVEHQRMMFDLQLHRMVFDVIVAPLVAVVDAPMETTTIDVSGSHQLPSLPLSGGAVSKKQLDVKHPDFGCLHNISRLGFRLIKQMVLGNPSFAVLLARYIPLMFELDGMKLHVVEVMHEIFTENAELPSEALNAAVDHYVKTLVNRQRSAGYLKFLATMCAQRDNTNGIVENQELVCRKLILDVPEEKSVLLSTVLLASGHVGVVWSDKEPPTSIERFLMHHPDAKLVKYFEGQIELFTKLSCGCASPLCAKTLEQRFPSLQLNGVVNTILWTGEEVAGTPSKLDITRCNLFKLAVNLYVHPELRNSENQLALNTILIGSSQLRNKWKASRHDADLNHSGIPDSVLMKSIKHAAMQLIVANPFVVINDRARNELLQSVVDVWCEFIGYRQYTTNELKQLLPMVVRLLNGKRDVPSLAMLAFHRSASNVSSVGFDGRHGSAARASHLYEGSDRGPSPIQRSTSGRSLPMDGSSSHTASHHSRANLSAATAAADPRRFEKTEDTVLVMELRRSICRLLTLVLRNMVHDEADAMIVALFEGLGGIRACGGGSSQVHDTPTKKDVDASTSHSDAPKDGEGSASPSFFRRAASTAARLIRKSKSIAQASSPSDAQEAPALVPISAVDTDMLLQDKVDSIGAFFQPQELVPLILDTAQYNHHALTTDAMNLLVELCCIRRRLCETVLAVKIMPSREMLSQFDRLHLVAVELSTAVHGNDVEEVTDAMEMVLKTMLQNYVPKNRLRSVGSTLGSTNAATAVPLPMVLSNVATIARDDPQTPHHSVGESSPNSSGVASEEASRRRSVVKFTEDSADEELAESPKSKRTAKSRWAEATTVAKLVAMSKRVQRKRNSLGLDPSSDVPMDVICRAELMCHWGIHQTLLDCLSDGTIRPAHPAYVEVMDFFYYFSLSPSNARQLSRYLQLFIDAIKETDDVRTQCMHVVVAVLSARAMRPSHTGGGTTPSAGAAGGSIGDQDRVVDVSVLSSLSSMIAQEHKNREPDSSFLRLVNKHLLGDGRHVAGNAAALAQSSAKQFAHLLHARSVFQYVAAPRNVRAAELQFNSSLVDLLCGICRVNRSVRSLAQRILPHTQLLDILLRKQRHEVLPRVHQAVYVRFLTEVFFSRDEESESERLKIVTSWMENTQWWGLLRVLARQYGELCNVLRRGGDTGSQQDERAEAAAAKDFWFSAVPSCITTFLAGTFSASAVGTHRHEVRDAMGEIASALCSFGSELSGTAIQVFSLTVSDVSNVSRCLRSLEDALDAGFDDAHALVDRLRLVRRFQMQDLMDELKTLSSPAASSSALRRDASRVMSASGASSSCYGNGSFFFQSNHREMSEAELHIRKCLSKNTPRDVIVSKALLKTSVTAKCFVQHLSVVSSVDTNAALSTSSSAHSIIALEATRRGIEAFVIKLLDHMAQLAFPADTISCLLNLLHAALIGTTLPTSPPLLVAVGGEPTAADALINENVPNESFASDGSWAELGDAGSPTAADGGSAMNGTTGVVDGGGSAPPASLTSDVLSAELEQRRLVARQVHFDRLGLMRVVTGLSDLSDHTVTKSALEVGIALLEGGNASVQNSMLQYFETHDESFFHNVRDILQSCMQRVQAYNDWLVQEMVNDMEGGSTALHGDTTSQGRQRRPTLAGASSSSSLSSLRKRSLMRLAGGTASPTTPSDSPPPGRSQAAPRYPGGNAFVFIAEIFRFLQLMCEGHHHGMQNYIRVQSDNLHSINVLQEVLQLIVELCAVRVDAQNATVVRKGLELLTEFCQGPCVENQATLLQNDVCALIAMILHLDPVAGATQRQPTGPTQQRQQGTVSSASDAHIPIDDVVDLQHAASVALLALTEGCSRPEVFQKILSQIPLGAIEALVRRLAKVPAAIIAEQSSNAGPSATSGRDLSNRGASPNEPPSSPSEAQTSATPPLPIVDEIGDDSSSSDDDTSSTSSDDHGNGADGDGGADSEYDNLLFNLLIFAKAVSPFLERSHDQVGLACIRRMFDYVPRITARLGSIQVERDGVVERVYFPIPDICLSLTHQSKDEVLWSVDRTSRLTKLNDFFQKIDELMFEMNSTHRFARRLEAWTRFKVPAAHNAAAGIDLSSAMSSSLDLGGTGRRCRSMSTGRPAAGSRSVLLASKCIWNRSIAPYLFPSDGAYYERCALVIAVAINVLFVFTNGVDRVETTTTFIEGVITCLCAIQLTLYIGLLIIDSVAYLPVYYYRGYRQQLRAAGIVVSTQRVSLEDVFRAMPSFKQRMLRAMHRFTTTYLVAMVVASVLALFVDPYFAAIHLFALINKSAVLRTVIVAITQNGKSLVLTMGLGVIVVYMFSIIGFTYFPQSFGGNGEATETSDPTAFSDPAAATSSTVSENCQTLGRCFMFILTNGLRQGGGVGDLMESEAWTSPILAPRMGYDFAFYALVNVVFLNILFGIIIDTFAELRDDKRRKEEDMNTCCFICGLDAEVFEKEGGGFKRHVRRDHNMWQYLYFIYHLRLKDPNEFTGQESYVYREMMRGSLGFFPDGKCLSLVKHLGQDHDNNPVGGDNNVNGGADGDGDRGNRETGGGDVRHNANNSGSQTASSTAAMNAVKADMDSMREQLASAIKDVSSEVSQLRSAALSGGVPDLMVSATAPSFGDYHNAHLGGQRGSLNGGAAGGLGVQQQRRRSKSVASVGDPSATNSASPSEQHPHYRGASDPRSHQRDRSGSWLGNTIDSDEAVTTLHAQIAGLQESLEQEKTKAAALQREVSTLRDERHAAALDSNEISTQLQHLLARFGGSSSEGHSDVGVKSSTSGTSSKDLLHVVSGRLDALLSSDRAKSLPTTRSPEPQMPLKRQLLLSLDGVQLESTIRGDSYATDGDSFRSIEGAATCAAPEALVAISPMSTTTSATTTGGFLSRQGSLRNLPVPSSTAGPTTANGATRAVNTNQPHSPPDVPPALLGIGGAACSTSSTALGAGDRIPSTHRLMNFSFATRDVADHATQTSVPVVPALTSQSIQTDYLAASEQPRGHNGSQFATASVQADDLDRAELSNHLNRLKLEHRRLQSTADVYLRDLKLYARYTDKYQREERELRAQVTALEADLQRSEARSDRQTRRRILSTLITFQQHGYLDVPSHLDLRTILERM